MTLNLNKLCRDGLPIITGSVLILGASFLLMSMSGIKSSAPSLPPSAPFALLSAGLLCLLSYYIKLNRVIANSRNNFRAIIDSAPFGFILTDLDLKIRGTNFFIAQVLRVTIPELIDSRLCDWLQVTDEHVTGINSIAPGESLLLPPLTYGSQKLQIRIHRPSTDKGTLFWHVQDITQQYEIEEKFEVLLNNLPIGVLEADREGNIITANPQVAVIAGSPETPSHASVIFTDQEWKKITNELYEASSTAKGSLDSGNRIISYSARLFSQGGHAHISCIVQDITEEIRLKEKLLLALEEVEAADRAKSSFLAKMSHEIRTPLNAVTGLAYVLKDKVVLDEAKELIQNIIDSSNHLTQLIGDILDISKIESGKMELDNRVFSPLSLLENMQENFSMLCTQKDLTFSMRLAPDLPSYVKGDAVRLKQIIYNIVGNSLKFVEEGGITLEVTCDDGLSKNVHLINFKVTDTGPGIPSEKLDKIFEPFVQEENGKKNIGTGLGLAITRELLALMDGSIKVSSMPGNGTTFEFSIPFQHASSEEISALEAETASVSVITKGRALVTDDVELNRKVLALLLKQHGWDVIQADSGERALEILEKDKDFSCIFMDVSMPGMDGTEAARKIKDELKINIPVIGVSAHAQAGAREQYLECCMDGYVTKPVNPEKLWREIGRVMQKDYGDDSLVIVKEGSEKKEGGDEKGKESIDLKKLIDTCQGSEELAKELLSDLLAELPIWKRELIQALGMDDLKEMRRICHKIRGTVSTLSIVALEEAALNLGGAARKGDIERLKPLAEILFSTMKETEASVRAIVAES